MLAERCAPIVVDYLHVIFQGFYVLIVRFRPNDKVRAQLGVIDR